MKGIERIEPRAVDRGLGRVESCYGPAMKDQRIPFIRKTLDSVLESLEASLRVNRWTDAEAIPEPLKRAADRLLEHLGAADRLTATQFRGNPTDTTRVEAMFAALKHLDRAYVAFRKSRDGSAADIEAAAITLTEEIDQVKRDNTKWTTA
jgi:hypothetical protein